MNRREAIQLLGGGIIVVVLPQSTAQAQDRLPNAYLQIATDGTITLFSPKIEMGQGVMTSLAQMAAEELDVPMTQMRAVMGDTQLCPADPDGGTWGSLTTRSVGPLVRSAAARARAILVQLAATQLDLPADQLITRDGFVIARSDETRRVSYAELAGGRTVEVDLDRTPAPQSPSQFTISGRPALRLDAVEKVTGRARYTADLQPPGLLHARILRPPARGARLKSVDTAGAQAIPGVLVRNISGSWVVLHEQPDLADRALASIKADYELPASGPDDGSIYSYLLARAPLAQLVTQRGTIATGEQATVVRADDTYHTPYVAHAPMEPHAALAAMEGGKLTVWASTQSPSGTRSETSAARVITPYVGGGFGGKATNPQAIEAAVIARTVGKPVLVAYSRAEEFMQDSFQCPAIIQIRSGLDARGRISFWDYQVYFAGDRGAVSFYDVPHHRTRRYGTYTDALPFPGGPWRAPGNNANTFARESHLDTLAALAAVDPVEFRLLHLKSTRQRNVLTQAAARFGWPPARGPSGRGVGVACGEDAGAFVVTMAEVAVDVNTGHIQVRRILCAEDIGQVINPEGARTQAEGATMMGLGYSLSEELHFSRGKISDLNFDTYSIPRFSWMPQIETLLIENPALSPQGGGEPAIITVGAALANAVFDATGVRFPRLPLTPERVLAGLQSHPPAIRAIERTPGGIRIRWDARPGWSLQRCASLTSPEWTDVPGSPGQGVIELPASDASAFFRVAAIPTAP